MSQLSDSGETAQTPFVHDCPSTMDYENRIIQTPNSLHAAGHLAGDPMFGSPTGQQCWTGCAHYRLATQYLETNTAKID
jgi:hypothetical protein